MGMASIAYTNRTCEGCGKHLFGPAHCQLVCWDCPGLRNNDEAQPMKLQRFEQQTYEGKPDGVTYVFWCPGCECHHTFNTERERRPVWTFNGDMERPTFAPSLLYPDKKPRCHLFLADGRLQFLGDCGHKLAGQTVDLPEIPTDQVW